MVKIIGAKAHAARLRGIRGPEMVRRVGAALFAGGNAIQVEAQLSITNGAKSGNLVRGERKKQYRASAPGEAPAEDTADLVNSIQTVQVEPLHVEVFADDRKAAWLEFGTSRMAERPYMRPATARKRREVTQMVRQAVSSTVRASKSGRRD